MGKSNSNSTSHLCSPLSFYLNGLLLVSAIIVKDLSAIPIQRRAITPLSRLPMMGYRLSKLNRFLKSLPLGLGNLSALIVHDCSLQWNHHDKWFSPCFSRTAHRALVATPLRSDIPSSNLHQFENLSLQGSFILQRCPYSFRTCGLGGLLLMLNYLSQYLPVSALPNVSLCLWSQQLTLREVRDCGRCQLAEVSFNCDL